jgi:predicted metal-dependent peptidase
MAKPRKPTAKSPPAAPATPIAWKPTGPADLLTSARSKLLMRHPFFGMLAVGMPSEITSSVPIAATDGRKMFWNPKFLANTSESDVMFVMAHEVMHCALEHIWRRGGRLAKLWNVACDKVINDALYESGLECSIPGILRGAGGKSSEEIYEKLVKQLENQPPGHPPPVPPGTPLPTPEPPGGGGGGGDPPPRGPHGEEGTLDDHGPWGEDPSPPSGDGPGRAPKPGDVNDPADPGTRITIDEWRARVRDAVKMARGKAPGVIKAWVDVIDHPKKDWRQLLWEIFPTQTADYSWVPYDRRFQGMMLPTLQPTEIRVVIAIDTSGSMPDSLVAQFWAEAAAILRNRGMKAHVMTCDTEIRDEWTEYEFDPVRAKIVGGGGTSFIPVFDRVRELQDAGSAPDLVVYLTDLEGAFPQNPPEGRTRVLWVVAAEYQAKHAPWGDVIVLDLT